MSDGNFNRALLPKNELAAGIRAGKAQMRTKAEQAFDETLAIHLPDLDAELQQSMKQTFTQLLRK